MDEDALPEGFVSALNVVEIRSGEDMLMCTPPKLQIYTFPDTEKGREEAEQFFRKILVERGATSEDIVLALSLDHYTDDDYALFIEFGGYKPPAGTV